MSTPVRILITDDHLIVREGLRLILETTDEFEVLGEAENGLEALKFVEETVPDVILMDLRMPVMGGLEAIEKLHATHPQIAVVILTTYNEDDLMVRGLQAGARGYLLKDTSRDVLFHTIRAAARGEALLSPEILQRLLVRSTPPPASTPVQPAQKRADGLLSERELEILQAVAHGDRSKEIAARLEITERTVKAHLASIYNKLGVDSRAAAIAVAAQKGLL